MLNNLCLFVLSVPGTCGRFCPCGRFPLGDSGERSCRCGTIHLDDSRAYLVYCCHSWNRKSMLIDTGIFSCLFLNFVLFSLLVLVSTHSFPFIFLFFFFNAQVGGCVDRGGSPRFLLDIKLLLIFNNVL